MTEFFTKLAGKLYLTLLAYSTRLRIVNKNYALPFWHNGRNVIYACWHSRHIFPIAYYYRYRYRLKNAKLCVIISQSRDGEYISMACESVGIASVRGSSSQGGSKAFSKLLDMAANGYDIAFTPDGPRGPREVVKPGVIELSQKTGLAIIPVSYSSSGKKIFNSWDRFMLPIPFAKTVLIFGKPIVVSPGASEREKENLAYLLRDTLKDITGRADEMVL